ncbi:MAG: ABC transporter permease [bacterium]|jgi:putative ABC transport system permease protein
MTSMATIRIALTALRRNKGRSLLTALGIIIGIAAVIAVVAVTQGASEMIREQISSMGNNILMVFPGSMRTGGFHGGAGTQQTLTADDADAILRECRYVAAISPIVRSGAQVVYRENNWSTGVQGVNSSYLVVRNWELDGGNFFGDSDLRSGARVCVLGATVAEQLFTVDDPVGKTIRIRNMPFQVLGTLARKGSAAFGQDQDDTILVPWTTARRVLQNSPFNNVNQLLASATSLEAMPLARQEMSAILRQRHHLSATADDDFTVRDQTEVTEMIGKLTFVMQMLLITMALISLVVGGIGIMNIMLVSVTERTREIGLRLAVGARKHDVLFQFLTEAIVLAVAGGVLGIFFGIVVAYIVAASLGWQVLVSVWGILIALGCATSVGVLFGSYPAWRAARLDPIESLRHE